MKAATQDDMDFLLKTPLLKRGGVLCFILLRSMAEASNVKKCTGWSMKCISFTNFQYSYISKQAFIIIAAVLLVAGCASPQQRAPVDDKMVAQYFGFLRVGETTQQEIVSRLGPPHETYENGLVMTYLVYYEYGEMRVGKKGKSGIETFYQLVLVFTSDHVLERFSLVFYY